MAELVMPIAEYSEYLNEVNKTLGINLKKDIEDYVHKGTHRGQSLGHTGLIRQLEDVTPISDNLGKETRVRSIGEKTTTDRGKLTKARSASDEHAAYQWQVNTVTQGKTTTVEIKNPVKYAEFLEYGSTPGQSPWPNPSSYPEPRTFKAIDPNYFGIHGTTEQKIWAGGRHPHIEGGPVAMLMGSSGREGWHSKSKGYSFDEFINTLLLRVREALSKERKNRARN